MKNRLCEEEVAEDTPKGELVSAQDHTCVICW